MLRFGRLRSGHGGRAQDDKGAIFFGVFGAPAVVKLSFHNEVYVSHLQSAYGLRNE